METLNLPKDYDKCYLDYNRGYSLKFEKDGKITTVKICEHKGTDYRRMFKISNVIKYYLWSLKQWLFWHNVHKQVGEWLKKHTKLNDTPDWG